MSYLLRTIRFWVMGVSLVMAVALVGYWQLATADPVLVIIRLSQSYALLSLALLYMTLLPGPLYFAFSALPGRRLWIRARRALGVSAALFALLHTLVSFFGQLDGWRGLAYLPDRFLTAIILGVVALAILAVMALTSFDSMVKRLGRAWKPLHRLVYLAGILTLVHTLQLGTHFIDLSQTIPQLLETALIFYFLLQVHNLDTLLTVRLSKWPRHALTALFLLAFLALYTYDAITPGNVFGISLHTGHR